MIKMIVFSDKSYETEMILRNVSFIDETNHDDYENYEKTPEMIMGYDTLCFKAERKTEEGWIPFQSHIGSYQLRYYYYDDVPELREEDRFFIIDDLYDDKSLISNSEIVRNWGYYTTELKKRQE